MGRPSFNRKERARLFALRGGVCYLCGGKIDGATERWEIEHEIPLAISRDNSDDNLRLAHFKCHKVKTANDAGDIARAKRRAAKHDGSARKTGWSTRFRKKIDGTVIDRRTGEIVNG